MNYQRLEKRYLVNSYPQRGITFVRGEGVYLYDDQGNRYLDMMSNYGVNIFGHHHPKITKALIKQISRLTNLHGSFTDDQRALASQELINRCGIQSGKVFWSNSGSEAVEAALKFAALATGKKRFVAAKDSYHGKTLGALSATGSKKYRQLFEPLLWEFVHVDFDDVKALDEAIDKQTAAIILEPIQGEAGVIVKDKNYLSQAEKLCRERKVLLILDEIQTGTGRTGTFLAANKTMVTPDIVCLGKGLAAGLPVGATVATAVITSQIPKLMHTNTFGGNPLTMAVVRAVIGMLDDKLLNHLKKILAIPAGRNVIRFLPPYIIDRKHIDQCVSILRSIV